jgi:hypothetical protein
MVTTTHGSGGSGRPRLVLTHGSATSQQVSADVMPMEYLLPADRLFVIGSEPSSDLVLPDLAPIHAQIGRDERDEFVVIDGSEGLTMVDGQPGDGVTMHTGDRLQVGAFEFVFQREESSDHGRPFGGRQGGEGAVQKPQPPREWEDLAPLPAAQIPAIADPSVD